MHRIEVKLAADDVDADTGTFSGYGAVFGNVDSYGDVIERGAFKRSLEEWKSREKLPPMLLQHGAFGVAAMDGVPIGRWTKMEENSRGLKVEGKLYLDAPRTADLWPAVKDGQLDGLSIGFKVRKDRRRTKPSEPRRTLEDVDLMEVSLVTFPANDRARVTGVKSAELTAEDIRDLEAALRDAGLSRANAKTAIACLRKWRPRDADDGPVPRDEVDAGTLAEILRRNIATITG